MQYAVSFLALVGAVSALPHAPAAYGYEPQPPRYNNTISTWSSSSTSIPTPSSSTTKWVPGPSGYPHAGPSHYTPQPHPSGAVPPRPHQPYPTGGYSQPPLPTGGHSKPPYPTGSVKPQPSFTVTKSAPGTGYITTTNTQTITKIVPTLVPCSTETRSNGQTWLTTYLSTSYYTMTTTSCYTSAYPAPTPANPGSPGHPQQPPQQPGHEQPGQNSPGQGHPQQPQRPSSPGEGHPQLPGIPTTPGQSYCPAAVTVTQTVTVTPTLPAGGACQHCVTETMFLTLPHDYTTAVTVTYPSKPTGGANKPNPPYPIPHTTTNKSGPTGYPAPSGQQAGPKPTGAAQCPAPGAYDNKGRYSCNPAHQYPTGQTCKLVDGCYFLIPTAQPSGYKPSSSITSSSISSTRTPHPTGYVYNGQQGQW